MGVGACPARPLRCARHLPLTQRSGRTTVLHPSSPLRSAAAQLSGRALLRVRAATFTGRDGWERPRGQGRVGVGVEDRPGAMLLERAGGVDGGQLQSYVA